MPIYHRRINGRMVWWVRVSMNRQHRSRVCATHEEAVQVEARLRTTLAAKAGVSPLLAALQSRPPLPIPELPAEFQVAERLGSPIHVIPNAARVSPIVYAWTSPAGEVRYVGMSRYGLQRPLGRGHQWLMEAASDEILCVWACRSVEEAQMLERKMIWAFAPLGNNRTSQIEDDDEGVGTNGIG